MASLRNAIPQRPYRERDQPNARGRHGLLEKHKDYSARARDYNAKKARLKILREKASSRNEDEFHFGMMSSKSKEGVKITERGNKSLSHEVVKLLKTQDAGYLRTMVSRTKNEREKLESAIQINEKRPGGGMSLKVLKDGGATPTHGQHTVFVDDENQQAEFNAEEWFHTNRGALSQDYNRHGTQSETTKDMNLSLVPDKTPPNTRRPQPRTRDRRDAQAARMRQRGFDQMRAKLEALKTREEALQEAIQKLDLQRARMNHAVGGITKKGVKFKVRERKK